jgi:uncharacterized protein
LSRAETAADAQFRGFNSRLGAHLFVVDGSRVYDLPASLRARLSDALFQDGEGTAGDVALLAGWTEGLGSPRIDGGPLPVPALASLSLNVAQACNMSCGYCYADEGRFGGKARLMSVETARASVDRLFVESAEGGDMVLGFMGGEPLLNRAVVHDATRYATALAQRAGRRIRFSITTNATLLGTDDARLFSEHPYTVTVSVDGARERHDQVRRMLAGGSAYDRMRKGLRVFDDVARPRHLSARITVTPRSGELSDILEHSLALGFDEVGFAAVLVSPDPALAFSAADFEAFTAQMIACGERTLAALRSGQTYPFGNFETAMHELHRGSHRPYPCGAGAAYLSVNAEGGLYACHRLVDDEKYAMGSVQQGSDRPRRALHLANHHVDGQEPCKSCWARYLCGGGCYHEVQRRGRVACDYIRSWLDFCLRAYVELSAERPDYFNLPRERVSS